MALRTLPAEEAIARLADFDAVIDARSESEHAEDRLPGAVNWPTLNDEERARIGTQYKQVAAFDARKQGAVLAARNIAAHIERHAQGLPQGWKPLVYCWRGGQRSGSLATVLSAIGFTVHLLEGGYREFRRAVLRELELLPATLHYRVLAGRTGSAKSRLLQALAEAGEQVLDLEALACHRGSVLGPLPGQPQPSQKAFETAVWQALRRFDPARVVWAESESRTVGRLRVPEQLMERLRAAPCVELQMPVAARVAYLLDDYAHFLGEPEAFCQRLDALRSVQGHAVIDRWQALARAGQPADWAQVVEELLLQHYDPVYHRSTTRNYLHFSQAQALPLADGRAATLRRAALDLQRQPLPTPPAYPKPQPTPTAQYP